MILIFEGQLRDIMGEDARKNWEEECGLRFEQGHQSGDGMTLFEVVNVSKASKYLVDERVTEITVSEADLLLAEKCDRINYKVTSEALMGANINSKAVAGVLDLDAMDPNWSEQQELEFLYNSGVSGIERKEIVIKKFVEIFAERA